MSAPRRGGASTASLPRPDVFAGSPYNMAKIYWSEFLPRFIPLQCAAAPPRYVRNTDFEGTDSPSDSRGCWGGEVRTAPDRTVRGSRAQRYGQFGKFRVSGTGQKFRKGAPGGARGCGFMVTTRHDLRTPCETEGGTVVAVGGVQSRDPEQLDVELFSAFAFWQSPATRSHMRLQPG